MAVKLRAQYYEQFDADYSMEVPAEAFGGWQSAELEIALEHSAVLVMHAWETGTIKKYPGWYRQVEYLARAKDICRNIFPKLLPAVRDSGMKLFHVVGDGNYYQNHPGYTKTIQLAGSAPAPPEQIGSDLVLEELRDFKKRLGRHNAEDIRKGFKHLNFAKEAKPIGNESIAENSHQLFALCKQHAVNHLIYTGFALNWCLLLSPGGMMDMNKHGIMCSVIRQAVTAVENKETARQQVCKQTALWRVALAFGYVFDVDDLIAAIANNRNHSSRC